MTTHSATAKLYTGIRAWCVDKNISAAITSTSTFYCLPYRLRRTIADIEAISSISLTNERYKTYGGGNNVITEGDPRVIDNTNNWKVNATVVCKFPTYLRIDVEKLQLPEGTDCTVSFEEGWILEGDFPGTTRQPSPEVKDFFTFRTPWYGVGKLQSAFSVFARNYKFRQMAAAVSSSATIVARGILNPGKFAALAMSNFNTTTAAGKITGILFVQRPYDIISSLTMLAGRLLTTSSNSNAMSSSMSITSELGRIRFGVSNNSVVSSMSIVANKTTEIELLESNFATMSINAIKTTSIVDTLSAQSSLSSLVYITVDGITPIISSSSLELVTDIRFIMNTNLNAYDYLGTPITNNTTVNIPIYPYTKAGTNVVIDWGDGNTTSYSSPSNGNNLPTAGPNHTYSQHGEYDIRIKVTGGYLSGLTSGASSGTAYPDTNWTNKLKSFNNFGIKTFGSPTSDLVFQRTFARIPYTGFTVPSEAPSNGSATSTADWRLEQMFEDCKANVTAVSNWTWKTRDLWLGSIFKGSKFNSSLSSWNFTNVTGSIYYGIEVQNASDFNYPITYYRFPSSTYTSGGQFSNSYSGSGMNSENWNRTLIAIANAVYANGNSGFVGNGASIVKPSAATTDSTNYGGTPYNNGVSARTYLTGKGWSVS